MYRGCNKSPNYFQEKPSIFDCLPWASIGNYSSEAFPGYGLGKTRNFILYFSDILGGSDCRNPDGRAAPYCFTQFTEERQSWHYCNVPRCNVNKTEVGVTTFPFLQEKNGYEERHIEGWTLVSSKSEKQVKKLQRDYNIMSMDSQKECDKRTDWELDEPGFDSITGK